jgi:predicted ATPase
MNIEKIHLQGFKSASNIELANAPAFSVLAGSNGSGKSNLADGLAFFGAIIKRGAVQALRDYGGYPHIHCFKHRKDKARTASLEVKITIEDQVHDYFIKIYDMDKAPLLEEKLLVDQEVVMRRKKGSSPELVNKDGELNALPDFPDDMSALMVFGHTPLYRFLTNIRVFRFDPFAAKEPDDSTADAGALDVRGRNVATMLSILEKNETVREEILEWIELLVPGLEKVSTEKQRLDGTTVITFKEEGLRARFPAKLISDGTIYALCILTAILSRSKHLGMTIIEEPERGIHPQGISQLVSLMRENASTEHPVFITTHSESVIRNCNANELWLVNKVEGKTCIKNAGAMDIDLGDLKLDMAWLMNMFDGGLPW